MTRALLVVASLLAASPLLAQAPAPAATAAQLRVVVLDDTGAGIPAAAVTVTPPGNQPLKIAADERGLANLPALPVGTVQLHVESPGFLPYDAPLTLRASCRRRTQRSRPSTALPPQDA